MSTPITQYQIETTAAFLKKMQGLGINAKFNRIEEGPVVTAYYITPSDATPLSKLYKHEEDFALAAKVPSVTMTRLSGNVVIFVPNKERKIIDYKDVAFHVYSERNNFQVPLSLGIDHLGRKTIIELTEQPHVLIGGQTGSGKSVLLKSIIANIAVSKTPNEVRMSFIDVKRLDLPMFSKLPHVLDVAKDVESAYIVLKDVLRECEFRYRQLEMKGVTNIREWNDRMPFNKYNYYVLIIDELATLLDNDKEFRKGKDKEELEALNIMPIPFYLKKLSQISRAAGVHIIAATQRPSAKILDGDVKANFPCRIALKLPSRFDSQTIINEGGAEGLLGKGDMLVSHEGTDIIERFHGPFVSINDVEAIINNLDMVRDSMEMMKGYLQ